MPEDWFYSLCSVLERDQVFAQQTVLRQLEAILSIHKLSRTGNYVDALREVAKLPFLPLDPRGHDIAVDAFENLSPHVQACIPDLLKVALTSLDNVADTDGSLRSLRAKVCFAEDKNLLFPTTVFWSFTINNSLLVVLNRDIY